MKRLIFGVCVCAFGVFFVRAGIVRESPFGVFTGVGVIVSGFINIFVALRQGLI